MSNTTTFSDWFHQLRPVTKWTLTFSLLLTVLASFNLIEPHRYLLQFGLIFSLRDLQLWRLVTNLFFFGTFSFPFVLNFIFFLQYSTHVEESFDGRTADYIWMLIFTCSIMTIASYFLSLPLLSFSLLMVLVYVWCRFHPNLPLHLPFIPIQAIPAKYFPWGLMALHLLMGGSIIPDLVGILTGHLYIFLDNDVPRIYGFRVLRTPSLLLKLFPSSTVNVRGFSGPVGGGAPNPQQQQQQQQPRLAGHQWGHGRPLGRNLHED